VPVPLSVIISCAGRGTRLGLGTTKALAEIGGRPLIAWQLDMLRDHDDIRVVVGYDAERLMDAVLQIRRDVIFVFNRDYRTTGTAASIAAAVKGVQEDADILSLDGDLLVAPADLRAMMATPGAFLGVLPPASSDPVYALTTHPGTPVVAFNRTYPEDGRHCYEWSGLFRAPAALVRQAAANGTDRGHVYQMLQNALPIPMKLIDAVEIDTPDDFARANEWLAARAPAWRD
jgi:choline kinase